ERRTRVASTSYGFLAGVQAEANLSSRRSKTCLWRAVAEPPAAQPLTTVAGSAAGVGGHELPLDKDLRSRRLFLTPAKHDGNRSLKPLFSVETCDASTARKPQGHQII
ncbi:unnamed protein product, partial [Hapterophycus canaliculatus]